MVSELSPFERGSSPYYISSKNDAYPSWVSVDRPGIYSRVASFCPFIRYTEEIGCRELLNYCSVHRYSSTRGI